MPVPVRPQNLRNNGDRASREWAVGSLPVGSWVEMYDLDDVLIYRGFVQRQSPWGGYTVISPTTEGDGNFIGSADAGTLSRLYKMSESHYVQEGAPVTWLGVDDELAAELVPATGTDGGSPLLLSNSVSMSLVPTVSLIPEEVYVDDDDSGNGTVSGTID